MVVTFNTDGSDSPVLSGNNLYINGSEINLEGDTQVAVANLFRLGNEINAGSTLNILDNAELTVTDRAIIGLRAESHVVQSDNSVANFNQASNALDIGNQLFPTGGSSYTINNGTLNVASTLRVRHNSDFDLHGGEVNANIFLVLDGSRFNITDGELNLTDDFRMTSTNTSTASFTGGVVNVDDLINITNGNELFLDGSTVNTARLNASSGGIININSGVVDVSGSSIISSGGIVNQRTSISIGESLTINNNTGAVWNAYNGELTVTNNLSLRQNGVFNQLAADVSVGNNMRLFDTSVYNQGARIITVDNNLIVNGDAIFNQSGGFTQIENSLNLNTNGVYNLNGGTLQVLNDIDANSSANFNLNPGGTLQVHDAANSIEFSGDFTTNGGTLDLTTRSEFLDVTGTLDLNGLIIDGYNVNLVDNGVGFEGSELLISAGSLTGDFSTIDYQNFIVTLDGVALNLDDPINPINDSYYWIDESSVNNDIHLRWRVIPEPNTIILWLLGGLPLLYWRVRR